MNSCGGATNVRPYGRTDIRSCQRCAIPVRPPEPQSPRLEPHLYRICGGLLPLKSELGSPNPVQVRSIPGPGLAGDTRPNPIGGAAAARSRFPWAPRPSLVYPRTCTYCDGGRHSRASACRPSPYEEFTVNATRRILSSARGDLVIRGKNMLRGGGKRRPPAHAGRLTRWERVAFAVLFILMLLYILAVTISAIRSGRGAAPPRGSGGEDHSLAVTRIQHATRG